MHKPLSLSFEPPSPGSWELERTHIARPVSTVVAETFPSAMMRGFAEGTRHYGILLDHLEVAIIHRFAYTAPRPVGAPKGAKGPPPRPVFALLRRLHPELRSRIRRAEKVWRDRLWREDVKLWDGTVKPDTVARARALRAEDIARYSTDELVGHLRRALDFLGLSFHRHHRFNPCVMVPQGDFIAHVMDWTDLEPVEILQAFRGHSPVSAGATDEIAAVSRAIEADRDAADLLASPAPPAEVLDALQARPAPVGPAARDYLDIVGLRVLGSYDVSEPHARERPDLLVKILRAAVNGAPAGQRSEGAAEAVAKMRARVPPDRQGMFDELLAEAQLTYRIRDERVFFGDALGVGLARRAILEAGRRLADQGLVEHPEHLVDAGREEMCSLLEGRGGPSAAELAERSRFRTETPMEIAPARLGLPPSTPPPASWLPPAAARLQRAVDTMLALLFTAREEKAPGQRALRGLAASPGVYEGRARVILDPARLTEVQAGEILVAPTTSPTFNVVLPLLGAIVTERGGALSHAAIVAREYGMPGVVGCVGAAGAIATGTRLRVDGGKGEVWILD